MGTGARGGQLAGQAGGGQVRACVRARVPVFMCVRGSAKLLQRDVLQIEMMVKATVFSARSSSSSSDEPPSPFRLASVCISLDLGTGLRKLHQLHTLLVGSGVTSGNYPCFLLLDLIVVGSRTASEWKDTEGVYSVRCRNIIAARIRMFVHMSGPL